MGSGSGYDGRAMTTRSAADVQALLTILKKRDDPFGVADDPELQAAAAHRGAQLAAHRGCEGPVEDTARLQILTERLRKLVPRVTAADVEQVAEMVADAEGIASRLAAVKEKFGLR